jgi:hypothetical protein
MSSQVIQQPAGNLVAQKHYHDTIENPVSIDRIMKFLTPQQMQELPASIRYRSSVPVWGVRPGKNNINIPKWERVQPGDVVVFSGNRKIFASGVVVHKLQNKDLGSDLWNPKDFAEAPYEYLYFLDEISQRDIAYADFNIAAGYSITNIPQGFEVLSEDKSANILFTFDLYSDSYFPPINQEEFAEAVKEFDPNKPLDAKGQSYSRVEQGYLRGRLFKNKKETQCCMCGKSFPIEFLVAAHIKKRSICSTEERLDADNIVAPMCKFGCDELFEKGLIGVDATGKIKSLVNIKSDALASYISGLTGKTCSHWRDSSEKYFEWHRQRTALKH